MSVVHKFGFGNAMASGADAQGDPRARRSGGTKVRIRVLAAQEGGGGPSDGRSTLKF